MSVIDLSSVECPIFLLPGMTTGYPVFSRLLPLLPNAAVVDFLPPEKNEPLTVYAERMAATVTPEGVIAGISFGGIVAQEISRVLKPRGCIVISSVCSPEQLPPWLRAWRIVGGKPASPILNLAGSVAALLPQFIRTDSTTRLTKLAGTSGAWHRWATGAVLNWVPEPEPLPSPVLRIHGDADVTFPVRYVQPDVLVKGGRHDLPVSHPQETATAILQFIDTLLLSDNSQQAVPQNPG